MNHTLLFLGPSDGHEEEREREKSLSPHPPIAMCPPPLFHARACSLPPPPASLLLLLHREPGEWREGALVRTPHSSDKRKTMYVKRQTRKTSGDYHNRERQNWCVYVCVYCYMTRGGFYRVGGDGALGL